MEGGTIRHLLPTWKQLELLPSGPEQNTKQILKERSNDNEDVTRVNIATHITWRDVKRKFHELLAVKDARQKG